MLKQDNLAIQASTVRVSNSLEPSASSASPEDSSRDLTTPEINEVIDELLDEDFLTNDKLVQALVSSSSSIASSASPKESSSTSRSTNRQPSSAPSSSASDDEVPLETQFRAARRNDSLYKKVRRALRLGHPFTIKGFPLAECQLIDNVVQYRAERTTYNNEVR